MKNILLTISLFALPGLAIGQNKTLNQFYREHKRKVDVQHFTLPGWLVRMGGKIAVKSAGQDEDRMALELLKKAGRIRILHAENGLNIPAQSIQKLREGLLKENYEDLVMVHSSDTDLQIMVREQGDVVRNLFLLANDRDGGEMVFISANINMKLEELGQLINQAVANEVKPLLDPHSPERNGESALPASMLP